MARCAMNEGVKTVRAGHLGSIQLVLQWPASRTWPKIHLRSHSKRTGM